MERGGNGRPARHGKIKVLVLDDSPVFRAGLIEVLSSRPELQVVGGARGEDGKVGVELALRLRPDVAVVDLILRRVSGLAVLESLADELPSVRVLFLSAVEEGAVIYNALQAGAAGYISKYADEREICDGIAAVASGHTFISQELTDALTMEIRRCQSEQRPELSARELEILALIAEGFSSPAIAKRLYVSHSTVKTHIGHLFDKLGVHERGHAVAEAFRRRLLV